MLKNEAVWRHLLVLADEGKRRTTLGEIASALGLSTSTIQRALDRPRQMGVVETGPFGIVCRDPERLLLYWATHRNLQDEFLGELGTDFTTGEIERQLPVATRRTGASGFTQEFGRGISDYGQVYVYGNWEELQKQFPSAGGGANLVVLRPDPWMDLDGSPAANCQIFADLFNTPGWEAPRFAAAIKDKLGFSDNEL